MHKQQVMLRIRCGTQAAFTALDSGSHILWRVLWEDTLE